MLYNGCDDKSRRYTMIYKITAEQTRNLMINILFGTKRDAKRTYNNILWCLNNRRERNETITEDSLKAALNFELGRYETTEDGQKVIFSINKDYSQTFFSAEHYDEGLELLHQALMTKDWYKELLSK